jgi:hypothetical protein
MPSILEWRVVPPGTYDAIIDPLEITFSTIVWLKIAYRVHHDGQDYCVQELLALEAPLDSPNYQRTAEGKGRIRQILRVLGLSEHDVRNYTDIETKLSGARVQIAVAHKLQHGLPVATVRAVIGKGIAPADGAATS